MHAQKKSPRFWSEEEQLKVRNQLETTVSFSVCQVQVHTVSFSGCWSLSVFCHSLLSTFYEMQKSNCNILKGEELQIYIGPFFSRFFIHWKLLHDFCPLMFVLDLQEQNVLDTIGVQTRRCTVMTARSHQSVDKSHHFTLSSCMQCIHKSFPLTSVESTSTTNTWLTLV